MNNLDFPQWLQEEMNKRGWGQSDLAREARINRQVIWGYLNRNKKPNRDILVKIAKAFDVPPEDVYMMAGFELSKPDINDPWIRKMVHKLSRVPASMRETVSKTVDAFISK